MGVELPLRVVVTILECCVTFSGVKLSVRSFVLFQQYKWKSWSPFLTDKLDLTYFGVFLSRWFLARGVSVQGIFARGLCPKFLSGGFMS